MTITKNYKLIALLGIVAFMALFLVGSNAIAGIISSETPAIEGVVRNYEFFASSTDSSTVATTTSAVSTNITAYFDSEGRYDDGAVSLAGAKKATFYFGRGWGSGNSGSSNFSVEVTPNGTDWYDFNKLVQNSATSTYPTTLSSITISAATSTVIASMDLSSDTFLKARCVVVETTDGSHTCSATVEY